MLIRHLEFFVTLAEEQHFGRAADLCGVSQPALSLAIRKLEEDLSTPLIIRGQRFMGLTVEGEKLRLWAQRILSDYGNLRDDLSGRRKGGLSGLLRLGVVPSAMARVPAIAARFEARNPMARLSIATMSPEAIQRAVTELTLDGGLTWLGAARGEGPQVLEIALPPDPKVFACREDHPFAPLAEISWRDALTQPLCLTDDLVEVERGGDKKRPARPAPAITCGSLDAVLAHIRTGLWCAVVPASFVRLLSARDDIVLCALSGGEALPAGVVLPKQELQSPMVRAFSDCIASLLQDGTLGAAAR